MGPLLALAATLGLSLLLTPPLDAQPPSKVPRVGFLRTTRAADPGNDKLRQALRDAGYVEGQTVQTEWRFSEGRDERLDALASELVHLNVDAIVTTGSSGIHAARQATTTIPIVAASDDLVAEGHVASLARPGGNVTGVSILGSELNLKRLEILKQAVPAASRVAALWDPGTGSHHLATLQSGAQSMGITLKILEVRKVEDVERAFRLAREWRAQALNVLASPLLNGFRHAIIPLAAKHRLPAIYQWDGSVEDGGLMAYGPTLLGLRQSWFAQLDRVLKGAKPAEVPVVQPTEFKLVLNLRTAKGLGLQIPHELRMRADQMVE